MSLSDSPKRIYKHKYNNNNYQWDRNEEEAATLILAFLDNFWSTWQDEILTYKVRPDKPKFNVWRGVNKRRKHNSPNPNMENGLLCGWPPRNELSASSAMQPLPGCGWHWHCYLREGDGAFLLSSSCCLGPINHKLGLGGEVAPRKSRLSY